MAVPVAKWTMAAVAAIKAPHAVVVTAAKCTVAAVVAIKEPPAVAVAAAKCTMAAVVTIKEPPAAVDEIQARLRQYPTTRSKLVIAQPQRMKRAMMMSLPQLRKRTQQKPRLAVPAGTKPQETRRQPQLRWGGLLSQMQGSMRQKASVTSVGSSGIGASEHSTLQARFKTRDG